MVAAGHFVQTQDAEARTPVQESQRKGLTEPATLES